ncbi:hypothetical protein [Pseudomonas nitroreducens]|uniref:hypothetical protein n=1 Tax=Pseudomonas nitroreducens TaxID=46680 RepID=UPI003D27E441
MNDRELLELAAKAVGYRTDHKWNAERLELEPAVASIVAYSGDRLVSTAWNTLENDGHALRLAIEIGIFDGPKSFAKFYPWLSDALVVIDDYASAFKRAITCYAAEIGRAMP